MDKIRLIQDSPADGPTNMATDEVLLGSAVHSQTATLRFYRWAEPTVSLGYFQRHADRAEHAASVGCPIVRRHTGGGAIVHDVELTYSLAWPSNPTKSQFGGRADRAAQRLYDIVHINLVTALANLGVAAELHAAQDTAKKHPNEPFLCFRRRAIGDVVLDGHKIMGSAQRRKRGALLQHGSLLLARSDAAPELPGLRELAPQLDTDRLISDWQSLLLSALAVQAQPTNITKSEELQVGEVLRDKFTSDCWTERR